MRQCRSWLHTAIRILDCASGRRGSRPGLCSGARTQGERVGQIPVPPKYTSADFRRRRTGRREASWMCRRSGSSSIRMRRGRPIRLRCWGGRAGITRSSRWRWRVIITDRENDGWPRDGSSRWWRAGRASAVGGAMACRHRSALRGEHGGVLPGAAHRPGGPSRQDLAELGPGVRPLRRAVAVPVMTDRASPVLVPDSSRATGRTAVTSLGWCPVAPSCRERFGSAACWARAGTRGRVEGDGGERSPA